MLAIFKSTLLRIEMDIVVEVGLIFELLVLDLRPFITSTMIDFMGDLSEFIQFYDYCLLHLMLLSIQEY